MKIVRIEPTIAVKTPAMAGKPEAMAGEAQKRSEMPNRAEKDQKSRDEIASKILGKTS